MYWQDDEPVVDQQKAEGHAVRAMYLYSGMADVAALTGDKQYIEAIDRIWNNMTSKKIYLQGGIGAVPDGERFGGDYELPNATAYNETCAAIGDVFWNERMFLLHGDAKYIDVLEKVLYNGLISGVGLDGKSFFYTNAMQVTNGFTHPALEPARSGWFECSCCPTNMVRFLPSLPGYIYALKENSLYVNLFISSKATLSIHDKPVEIVQQNNYPWAGLLNFTVQPSVADEFEIHIRIPGWAQNKAIPSGLYSFESKQPAGYSIKVNGKPAKYRIENGYAIINKKWAKGDKVQLKLEMPVRTVVASADLKEDKGKVALQRGPIIYCAEWKDNGGTVSNLVMPAKPVFKTQYDATMLNGIMKLKGEAFRDEKPGSLKATSFTAIPYYAWANRGKGEMQVWFPDSAGH
jgi:DUF1680 family protein